MFSLRISENIELGLLEPRHADKLFALVEKNREHLREWLTWVDDSKSATDTEQFIKTSLNRYASNGSFTAGILYKSELAGVIELHKIDWSNRSTSIGYWLSASFEGKGVMTDACRGLVEYAFNELHLNRVTVQCATENKKSRAIPARLGFKQEGTIRQVLWLYDRFVDLAVYGILASDRKSY